MREDFPPYCVIDVADGVQECHDLGDVAYAVLRRLFGRKIRLSNNRVDYTAANGDFISRNSIGVEILAKGADPGAGEVDTRLIIFTGMAENAEQLRESITALIQRRKEAA